MSFTEADNSILILAIIKDIIYDDRLITVEDTFDALGFDTYGYLMLLLVTEEEIFNSAHELATDTFHDVITINDYIKKVNNEQARLLQM